MQFEEDKDVQQGPSAIGFVAVFLAGVTVATTVALLAARSQGTRFARQTDNVLDACDRAIQTLERRVNATA